MNIKKSKMATIIPNPQQYNFNIDNEEINIVKDFLYFGFSPWTKWRLQPAQPKEY